ncbi:MAG: septal ring lytic transglycosylase RlpA family protein [Chitinophagales bacterium]|nr:septal ring lytic transglycosylase RlpA family protein [Chitinophagales bacterium]
MFASNASAQTASLIEAGIASYYHDKFAGRKTANGERFSQAEYTCAHKSLPFGTKIKVTNLKNGKSAIVRVNDRGPFKKGRVVDLSRAVAAELGFLHDGLTTVALERVPDAEELIIESPFIALDDSVRALYAAETEKPVTIKLGDFENREHLREMVTRANNELGREVMVQTVRNTDDELSYIVFVGIFYRQEDAHDFLEQIEHYYPKAEVAELALAPVN